MLDHHPVMLQEVLSKLFAEDSGKRFDASKSGIYIDCTFGAGGYTKAMLESRKAKKVYALDCDPDAEIYANKLKKEMALSCKSIEKVDAEAKSSKGSIGEMEFVAGNFADLDEIMSEHSVDKVSGIVMDLGVSSMQLDKSERGFSFSKKARLDMRMSKSGYSAYDFVNEESEQDIADTIFKYGDERNSRKIAKNIVEFRKKKPIETTTELADIVRGSFNFARGKIDFATKTFQAIRIYVNKEMESLERGLQASEKLLEEGGRLVVVSFHSLEDTIIKRFIKERSQRPSSGASRYIPDISFDDRAAGDDGTTEDAGIKRSGFGKKDSFIATFINLTKKAEKPTRDEILLNSRARSAKLRAAEKKSCFDNNDTRYS